MARPRQRRRRRSRGGGRFLSLYLVLAVVVTAVVIGAGCIVFFKVNQFEVEGNQRYSTEEIAKASGVSKGDNLFLVNKTETARKLLDELAYVRSVNIKRKLPDTLVITVAETNAAAVSGFLTVHTSAGLCALSGCVTAAFSLRLFGCARYSS